MRIPNEGELKYSILVPVHDKLGPLQRCMESLRNQTYPNYEIIIVDDASCNEVKLYLQFLEQIDKRIKLSRNINRIGTGESKNLLLKQSTGDYIIFINPTDYVEINLLEEINNELKKNKVDIIHYNTIVEGATPSQVLREYHKDPYRYSKKETDIISGEEGIKEWLIGNDQVTTTPWSYCVSERLYDKVVFPNSSSFEDIPVTPVLLANANKVKGIPYVGYHLMQYDNPNSNESDTNKRILLQRKLDVLKNIISQAIENIKKTDIKIDTKMLLINDLKRKYNKRLEQLQAKTNQVEEITK